MVTVQATFTPPTFRSSVSSWLTRAGRQLQAAVVFVLLPVSEPELRLLHGWLDSWRGGGDVGNAMHRRGYDRFATIAREGGAPCQRT